jgi:hypothetical protein
MRMVGAAVGSGRRRGRARGVGPAAGSGCRWRGHDRFGTPPRVWCRGESRDLHILVLDQGSLGIMQLLKI